MEFSCDTLISYKIQELPRKCICQSDCWRNVASALHNPIWDSINLFSSAYESKKNHSIKRSCLIIMAGRTRQKLSNINSKLITWMRRQTDTMRYPHVMIQPRSYLIYPGPITQRGKCFQGAIKTGMFALHSLAQASARSRARDATKYERKWGATRDRETLPPSQLLPGGSLGFVYKYFQAE